MTPKEKRVEIASWIGALIVMRLIVYGVVNGYL